LLGAYDPPMAGKGKMKDDPNPITIGEREQLFRFFGQLVQDNEKFIRQKRSVQDIKVFDPDPKFFDQLIQIDLDRFQADRINKAEGPNRFRF